MQLLVLVPSGISIVLQMEACPLHLQRAPTATSAMAYQYDCNTCTSPKISSPNVFSRSREIRRSVAVTHSCIKITVILLKEETNLQVCRFHHQIRSRSRYLYVFIGITSMHQVIIQSVYGKYVKVHKIGFNP